MLAPCIFTPLSPPPQLTRSIFLFIITFRCKKYLSHHIYVSVNRGQQKKTYLHQFFFSTSKRRSFVIEIRLHLAFKRYRAASFRANFGAYLQVPNRAQARSECSPCGSTFEICIKVRHKGDLEREGWTYCLNI